MRSWPEESDGTQRLPRGTLAYFRERFINRLHSLVIGEFAKQANERGLTKADVSRMTGKQPAQITRLLGAPGNWTLDTVSDLLLAMGCEPKIEFVRLSDQDQKFNIGPDWLSQNNIMFPPSSDSDNVQETSIKKPTDNVVYVSFDTANAAGSER